MNLFKKFLAWFRERAEEKHWRFHADKTIVLIEEDIRRINKKYRKP